MERRLAPMECPSVKEYDIYVPVNYNDGSPVEDRKIEAIGRRLLDFFGGLNFSPQPNKGYWRMGNVTFRDEVVIMHVLADKVRPARKFLRKLKEEMKRDLRQEAILIVEKEAGTL
jgi:hypothetical protein